MQLLARKKLKAGQRLYSDCRNIASIADFPLLFQVPKRNTPRLKNRRLNKL